MSSATVLDSIIEGVRADVAAREAVVSMADVKAAAHAARSTGRAQDFTRAFMAGEMGRVYCGALRPVMIAARVGEHSAVEWKLL